MRGNGETYELISVLRVFAHHINHNFLQLKMREPSKSGTSELELVSSSICRGKMHVSKHYPSSSPPIKKPTMMNTSFVFPIFL